MGGELKVRLSGPGAPGEWDAPLLPLPLPLPWRPLPTATALDRHANARKASQSINICGGYTSLLDLMYHVRCTIQLHSHCSLSAAL